MDNETTPTGIAAEMTIADAVDIARREAEKSTGDVRAALTMLADYAQQAEAETPKPAADPKPNTKSIGITANGDHILAWNYLHGLAVCVVGTRERDAYLCKLLVGDAPRAFLCVYGGLYTAKDLCLGLRNFMTRRILKVRRSHLNRKLRRAAANLNSKEVQP